MISISINTLFILYVRTYKSIFC